MTLKNMLGLGVAMAVCVTWAVPIEIADPAFEEGKVAGAKQVWSFSRNFRIARASTVFPLAVKSAPAQEKTAVTVSKMCGAAVANKRRAPARVRIFFSLSGSAARSVFASSIVGMIAWWSDTFLLFSTLAISGEKLMPSIKGSVPHNRAITFAAVSSMSSVR